MDLKTGDKVWLLANGWWRRGIVLAKLRTKVIVRYCVADGKVRETRRHTAGPHCCVRRICSEEELRSQVVDPDETSMFDRPIAKHAAPELVT